MLSIAPGQWINGWSGGPGTKPDGSLGGHETEHTGVVLVLAIVPWEGRVGVSWGVLMLSGSGVGWAWQGDVIHNATEVLIKVEER
jgi:hypothetical protein